MDPEKVKRERKERYDRLAQLRASLDKKRSAAWRHYESMSATTLLNSTKKVERLPK